MRRIGYFIALLLVVCPLVMAGSHDVADIANPLKGKVLTLRSFYSDFYLHYDSAGQPLEDTHTSIWTTDSALEVKSVQVNASTVTLDCARLWVVFEGNAGEKRSLSRTDRSVKINIDLAGTDTVARFNEALKRIFVQNGESMADVVPPIWKPYFNGDEGVAHYRETMNPSSSAASTPTAKPVSAKTESSTPAKPADTNPEPHKLPTMVRVSQGVAQRLLVRQVKPVYPELARLARLSGYVVLRAIITTEGDLRSVYILKPVGGGLDESAHQAVSQWKYKPYVLEGQPVEVDTQIIVNYTLSR